MTDVAWMQFKAESPEQFVVRGPAQLADPVVRKQYPQRIHFGFAYADEGSGVMPGESEWRQIEALEAALLEARPIPGAYFSGSLTSDGYHQFIFYCHDSAGQIPVLKILLDNGGQFWEKMLVDDPEWEFVEQLTKYWRG